MTVFVAVAENDGFAAAGRALGLAAPVVTRSVAALETHLGVKLFVRTTRQVRLTEAGERYLEDCRRILGEVAEAEAAAAGHHAAPQGLLTLSAPQLFGRYFALPILLEFLDAHPALQARLLFLDRLVHLVEEGVDVAVRLGRLPDSALRATKVGAVRRVVCAAPSYLAQHGAPRAPEDLPRHRLIAASVDAGAREWRFGVDEATRQPIEPRLQTTTNDSAVAAAVAGWGVARLMSYQVADPIADGRLRRLMPDHEPAPIPVHVLHAHGARPPAKVRGLVDRLVEGLRANPAID